MRDTDSIGGRTAAIRKLRGLSGRQLADRAHISYSLLTKVETGKAPASPAFTAAVARALAVPVNDLTGQPYRRVSRSDELAHGAIPELRREVASYTLPPAEEEPPPRSLVELAAAVEFASEMRHRVNLTRLGEILPPLLAELRGATYLARNDADRNQAYRLLAESWAAAGQLAWKLGYIDLASMITDRYEWAAAHADDHLAVCIGEYMRAGELVGAGDWTGAERTIAYALRRLEADLGAADAPTWSTWGNLHLKGALIAARSGKPDAAWDHHREAQTAADHVGVDRDDYRLCFGPTNVAIWGVGLAVELGDGTTAVQRAENLRIPSTTQRERAGHHYIDLARGYLQHGDKQQSLRSLYTARKLAPQQTRYHPMVHETLHALARAERRSTDTLRSLATWVGIQD
jgi:transcriptional regulator with XRE-family HTH domain